MRQKLLMILVALAASESHASTPSQKVQETIISDISISLSSIPGRPHEILVKIKGRILLGTNACESSSKIALVQSFGYYYQWYFRPVLIQRQYPQENCNQLFKPSYQAIQSSFVLAKKMLPRIKIVNVEGLGEVRSLRELSAASVEQAHGRLIQLFNHEQDTFRLIATDGTALALSFSSDINFAINELLNRNVRVSGRKSIIRSPEGLERVQLEVQNIELLEELEIPQE